jgi:hypothetical protein
MRVRSGGGYEAGVEDVVVPKVLMGTRKAVYRDTALKIFYGPYSNPLICTALMLQVVLRGYRNLFTSTAVGMPDHGTASGPTSVAGSLYYRPPSQPI